MLESLYVKNLALIDKSEVQFTSGLNVLSGETGAGKSIIIGSVLLALGGKIPKDIIRNHEKEAYVELIFSIHHESVKERLKELDIFLEEGQLILSRRITPSRSQCRINGEAVTVAKVREVAGLLIDIHGQHEHQKLLYSARQLELVDRCDRKRIEPLRQQVGQLYQKYQLLCEDMKRNRIDESVRLRTMDILQYEIDEIEQARIEKGEEEELEREWKRLSNQEKIRQLLFELEGLLSGEEHGASDLLGSAVGYAKELAQYHEDFEQFCSQLADAESVVADCYHEVSRFLSDNVDDDGRLEEVTERLDKIRHLFQKYGCGEEGLLSLLEQKKEELEGLLHLEERKKEQEKQAAKFFRQLQKKAAELTVLRRESAGVLEKQLTEALIDLNFLEVRFEVRMGALEHIGHNGGDEVEFYISTNPGEPLKPLAMVASGGELSRIMLALKSVLAEREETETLIFDEIDAGISGRTAQKVGGRLCVASQMAQVICISHLPQIISMADTHFLIEKDAVGQTTTTHIKMLNEKESIRELARLLGGTEITDRVLENAREMKEMAKKQKYTHS